MSGVTWRDAQDGRPLPWTRFPVTRTPVRVTLSPLPVTLSEVAKGLGKRGGALPYNGREVLRCAQNDRKVINQGAIGMGVSIGARFLLMRFFCDGARSAF